MLSRANSVTWMGGENQEGDNSWSRNPCNVVENNNNNVIVVDNVNSVVNDVSLTSFKSMLEVENEWYNNNNNNNNNNSNNNNNNINNNNVINFTNNTTNNLTENLLLNQALIDSSSSCSPSPSVFNQANLDPSQISYLFPSKGNIFSNPLSQSFNLGGIGNSGFFQEAQNNHQLHDLGMNRGNVGVLGGFNDFSTPNELSNPNLGGNLQFSNAQFGQLGDNQGFGDGFGSKFRGFEDGLTTNPSLFVNRGSKLLKPLDNSTPIGAQPTLFQKRAALRKNFGSNIGSNSNGGDNGDSMKLNCGGENDKKRKMGGSLGILDNLSFDGSSFNYDSDDFTENNNDTCTFKGSDKNGGTNSNANSGMTGNVSGDTKGKKKGLPAKNLMAERRRRKKLNDRLYMLRSVVPKISKMDRASILGDAIEYLKELLQKINDLHNELESSPPTSTLTQTTNFHPLTPTLPNLPSRIKEELCPSSLPSPNGQPARIEVRMREGRAVNIHMFCGRRPGLLLSTMRALDGLGLDIQQAVISCFNGFAMDIFRAEQCKDGQDVHPEQIKALLLELATFHGSNLVGNCNM